MSDRIELSEGIIAYLGETDIYSCNVYWLGRDIKVELYSSEEDYEDGIEELKKTFDKFWNNKTSYLKQYQNDITEKLLPYIAENESSIKFIPYPDVSEDDFYSDYWLSHIYICDDAMQFFFSKEGDENDEKVLSVNRYIDNGEIISFMAGDYDIYPNDMGL